MGKLIPEVSNFTMRSSSPKWGWRWEGDILGKITPGRGEGGGVG